MEKKVFEVSRMTEEFDNQKVKMVGMLESLSELVTVSNNDYIEGVIADNGAKVTFKVWGKDMELFSNTYKITPEELPVVVEVVGSTNFYNGIMGVKATSVRKLSDISLDKFLYSAPYKAEAMIKVLKDKVTTNFTSDVLRTLCLMFFENYEDKLKCYPYSSKYHTEKAGLLYHLYLCIARLYTEGSIKAVIGGKEVSVNTDVVATAILFSRTCGLRRYKVDEITGVITSKNDIAKALYGEYENMKVLEAFRSVYEDNFDEKISANPEYCNVEHCILALYGYRKPATQEAERVIELIHSDLKTYAIHENLIGLKANESKPCSILGDSRVLVNLNPPTIKGEKVKNTENKEKADAKPNVKAEDSKQDTKADEVDGLTEDDKPFK